MINMFKKRCPRCEKKVDKGYDFCPYCGLGLKGKYDEEDYGFLGKNDLINENNMSMPQNSLVDKMFSSAMKMAEKMIEKQMKNMPELNEGQIGFPGNMRVQFFVNGKRVPIDRFPLMTNAKKKPKIEKRIHVISKEKMEKLAKLPKKEPTSEVRRMVNKVIDNLEVPGVNDIDDIFINKLESSIEIKAISDDKVYSKILNVNLPILRYGLSNGNLIIEMQGK